MQKKIFPAVVLTLGLLILGGAIMFILDHRPQPYNGPVTEVTSANFQQEVLNSQMPVYVEFYVDTSKCKPCARQQPIIDKLAEEYKGKVRFVRIEALKNQDIAAAAGIQSVPTHFLMKPADNVGIAAKGFLDEDALRAFIEKGLAAQKPAPAAPAVQPTPPATPAAPAIPATPPGGAPAVTPTGTAPSKS